MDFAEAKVAYNALGEQSRHAAELELCYVLGHGGEHSPTAEEALISVMTKMDDEDTHDRLVEHLRSLRVAQGRYAHCTPVDKQAILEAIREDLRNEKGLTPGKPGCERAYDTELIAIMGDRERLEAIAPSQSGSSSARKVLAAPNRSSWEQDMEARKIGRGRLPDFF